MFFKFSERSESYRNYSLLYEGLYNDISQFLEESETETEKGERKNQMEMFLFRYEELNKNVPQFSDCDAI
jgi:hypothetical protein